MHRPLRLGTRGSVLALAQAEETRRRLAEAWPALAEPGAVEIVVVRTTGDRVQDRALSEIGGKGLFAKELEEALANGAIDVAVHALKDLPSVLHPAFRLASVLERADARDSLISRGGVVRLNDLPIGTVLATSSLRRQAMALALRPDLSVRPVRGNIDTRLRKLEAGTFDALLLAEAGLVRIGLAGRGVPQPIEDFLPAVAQGAIGLEVRAEDDESAAWLVPVNHRRSWLEVTAERSCLAALDGSCVTPVGVLANVDDDRLRLGARFILPDGTEPIMADREGALCDLEELAGDLGRELRRRSTAAHLALLN